MQITKVLTLLSLATVFWSASPAKAAAIISLQQVSSDVVATGSGTLDLTDLTVNQLNGGPATPNVFPSYGGLFIGASAKDDTYNGISGPTSIGTTQSPENASSGTGAFFGAYGSIGRIGVPANYVSGSSLSGTATWNLKTLASLGVATGTYTWTWGTGPHADSLTLYAGVDPPSETPEPATFALLGAALVAGVGFKLRAKR